MSQPSQSRRSRVLPKSRVTPEEWQRRKIQRQEVGAQCRNIFERLSPQLIEKHYNWFIAIDADSENYMIDPKLEGLLQQVRHHVLPYQVRVRA